MSSNEDFQIKYWGENFQEHYNSLDQKRSAGKKLLIVLSFIAILSVLPALVFGLSNLEFTPKNEISSINQIKPSVTPTPIKKSLEKAGQETSGETVLNNDSYWKISKRHCGTGRFYLSIRDQNAGKPLYRGDFVEVACSL